MIHARKVPTNAIRTTECLVLGLRLNHKDIVKRHDPLRQGERQSQDIGKVSRINLFRMLSISSLLYIVDRPGLILGDLLLIMFYFVGSHCESQSRERIFIFYQTQRDILSNEI